MSVRSKLMQNWISWRAANLWNIWRRGGCGRKAVCLILPMDWWKPRKWRILRRSMRSLRRKKMDWRARVHHPTTRRSFDGTCSIILGRTVTSCCRTNPMSTWASKQVWPRTQAPASPAALSTKAVASSSWSWTARQWNSGSKTPKTLGSGCSAARAGTSMKRYSPRKKKADLV